MGCNDSGNKDSIKDTELRLGPPGTSTEEDELVSPPPPAEATKARISNKRKHEEVHYDHQVVGWPPVSGCRKIDVGLPAAADGGGGGGIYVKVSKDGAPYLRKVDLKVFKGYRQLSEALQGLFICSAASEDDDDDEEEYAVTYEDKDGDWMMVGDVPWRMFVSSCRRLRITRASEARGLT